MGKATLVKCLGWCNKQFLSPDPTRLRFCRKCAVKKEQNERNGGKVASIAEGIKIRFEG
jgi:hypothetical protein